MPRPSPRAEIRRARPLLGTLVEIGAAGAVPERVHAAIDAAFAAIERVQRLMSVHDPASELSALNLEAHRCAVHISEETHFVLKAALAFSRASEGAFDVCVGRCLRGWGYLPFFPGPACGAGDWRDIELLDDRRVRFRRALCIDLGGIAKGYAVDCAIAVLREAGAESGVVNAGGDLRVFGPQAHCVSLRNPGNPGSIAYELKLKDEALASSASYFSRRLGGAGAVSALLDPRSGQPSLDDSSVSVRAADCLSADALTKVVLFASPALSESILTAYDARAFIQAAAIAAA